MSKLRVYELARELNVESKVMVTRLKEIGIDVASHQSTLTDSDVEKARKTLTGASASPAESKAKSPKVVIRRRRGADEEIETEIKTADSKTTVVRRRTVASGAVGAEPKAAAQSSAEASKDPVIDSGNDEAEVSVKQEAVNADSEEQTPEQQKAKPEAKEPSKSPDSKKIAAKPVGTDFSATIVRRATVEEQQAVQSAAEAQKPSGRREDSRGTRIVNPSRDPAAASERVTAIHSDMHEAANRGARKTFTKDRGVEKKNEEEALRLRTQKQKRQKPLNVKSLLNQLGDSGTGEDVVQESRVRRKVFTPDAASRRKDYKRRKDLKRTQITTPRASYRVVEVQGQITVAEFAKQLSTKSSEIIKKLMDMGLMVTINANIDYDTAVLIASEYHYEVRNTQKTLEDILPSVANTADKELKDRPPIVTVMGHVDHGKTSILDAIRKTNVTKGEAGGITQHIGAYSVVRDGHTVTFIDTPGHEAFSSMRARGADLTDIVVLVVAADDGVMPQTVEAISHAKAAGVPIIVAVNKIDKPGVNLDRLFTQLAEHGIQSEEWGGEDQFVKVSAIEGTGISELLESILLQAEILELKAIEDVPGEATVVEANVDKGRGPVATVIIRHGSLKKGDCVVVGEHVGRIRAMADFTGKLILTAGPSTPVELIGLENVPNAGDRLNVVPDEKKAREAADWRIENAFALREQKSSAQSLEDLLNRVQDSKLIEVPFILKADTKGSIEAIVEAMEKVKTEQIRNRVIHKGVGGINESDLALAETTGAVIIGFSVRAPSRLDEEIERRGVIIKYFNIIYEVVDAVKSIMAGSLPPIKNEVTMGHAQVRDAIRIPKIGLIAGSSVTDGKLTRASKYRLIRDDVVIFEGKCSSLRRFKEDVSEVAQGYECGISLEGWQDIQIGDVIEAFVIEETEATL
jgi:translation initiation factor IF-2